MAKRAGIRDDDILGRLDDAERRLYWLEANGLGEAVDTCLWRLSELEKAQKPVKGKKE